jgi:hypothetical protein
VLFTYSEIKIENEKLVWALKATLAARKLGGIIALIESTMPCSDCGQGSGGPFWRAYNN